MSSGDLVKEGLLRKRSGRMQRWALRYFSLYESKLSYRLKGEASFPVRGEFDLSPGCVLTEVIEDSMASIKGRKLFSFWIVWPHDKRAKSKDDENKHATTSDYAPTAVEVIDSDGDEDMQLPTSSSHHAKHKDLKQIVATEMMTQRNEQKKVEEQVENHKAHDANMRLGVKVAAVAVGGVIVGALTAGIGLVPYITVVGITAVAGGGAVALQYKRPSDSRLILACESMDDAVSWKTAIEQQINKLEKYRQPMLPATADPQLISNILGMSAGGSGWHTTSIFEGVKLLEQSEPIHGTRCRKAQLVVRSAPVNAFLSLMESHHWPRGGSIKVDKVIDDHADIVSANLVTSCGMSIDKLRRIPSTTFHRELKLCRFWKLDDDGVYLITFNKVKSDAIQAKAVQGLAMDKVDDAKSPSFDAVITISPRRDHDEYDVDLPVSLIVCTCQVSTTGWEKGELENVMDDFLKQQLLDLRHSLLINKYAGVLHDRDQKNNISVPVKPDNVPTGGKGDYVNKEVTVQLKTASRARAASPTTRFSFGSHESSDHERAVSPGRAFGSSISKSHSRFGITTIQPGVEDHTLSSSSSLSSTTAAAAAAAGTAISKDVSTQPSKRMLFRRSSSKDKAGSRGWGHTSPSTRDSLNAAVAAGTSSIDGGDRANLQLSLQMPRNTASPVTISHATSTAPYGATAAASAAAVPTVNTNLSPSTRSGRFSSRRKSKTANPKASNLRGQIAAKEYEVQRTEKMLKKQGASLASDGTSVGGSLGRASEVDLASYQGLLKELHALKAEYLDMTGVPYEQTSRRLVSLSRFRSLGNRGSAASSQAATGFDGGSSSPHNTDHHHHHNNNNNVQQGIALQSATTHGTEFSKAFREKNRSELPIHWQISSTNRKDLKQQLDTEAQASRHSIVYMIIIFSVCFSLSTFVSTFQLSL